MSETEGILPAGNVSTGDFRGSYSKLRKVLTEEKSRVERYLRCQPDQSLLEPE